jgi:aryl-alcohol dehydrogenase-like predicted oxidoreductase
MNVSKLGLGTVQFGLDYGISNRGGRTDSAEAARIVQAAEAAGLRVIDTAPGYGASESVLGQVLPVAHRFDVVTKVAQCAPGASRAEAQAALQAGFAASLGHLRARSVHGLIMHDADDLLGENGPALWDAMRALQEGGQVQRIGASVYNPAQIDAMLSRYPLQLIQLPLNVFDQRALLGGQLQRLHDLGVEVHARSTFLQGLLLMEPNALDPYFAPLDSHFAAWRAALQDAGTTPMAAALHFVAGLPQIDCVVCGVNTAAQLAELVACLGDDIPALPWAHFALGDHDERFVDPTRWRLQGTGLQ